MVDACVVDENVQPTERVCTESGKCLDVFGVGDVEFDGMGIEPLGTRISVAARAFSRRASTHHHGDAHLPQLARDF